MNADGKAEASPPFQTKQTRHWSLTRMLCWPSQSPESLSSRLAGGLRRSLRSAALLSMRSLRSATVWMSFGSRRENRRLKTFSVSASRNDLIMRQWYNATRYTSKG